jgi:hypothetical protein
LSQARDQRSHFQQLEEEVQRAGCRHRCKVA